MQAYHPVASRDHAFRNEAPLLRQQQHPYNMAPQRLPASMNSKQLDTWTLYELAREKQNMMQFDDTSKSEVKKAVGIDPSPSHHDAPKKKSKKKTAKSSQKKKSQHGGSTVAKQRVSSSIEPEEMDPWTLYELEQETQEEKKAPKSKSSKAKKEQTVALSSFLDTHKTKKRTNSSRTKNQQDDKKIGRNNSHANNNSRHDPWSPELRESVESTRKSRNRNVLLPLGRTYPEHIRQRIALAKSKRKNLLSEVNHNLYLYKGPRRSKKSINSLLEDCNASLPNILLLDEEDSNLSDLAFELPGEGDEDDNHSSCYF